MDIGWVHFEESIVWMKTIVPLRDQVKELALHIEKATMKDDKEHWESTVANVVDEGIFKNNWAFVLWPEGPLNVPVVEDTKDHA